jgi:uncharacterized alpha-E superfamily protein
VLNTQRPPARPWEIIALDRLLSDVPAPDSSRTDPDAWLHLADAVSTSRVRQALSGKRELLDTVEALSAVILASEKAGERPRDDGWRLRVLGRCAERLRATQNTLHKRLQRIRDLWPKE